MQIKKSITFYYFYSWSFEILKSLKIAGEIADGTQIN